MNSECSVLLVEDEWLLRADIAAELQQAGWTVLEASTGEGALSQLRAGRRIDVLITDIQLAGYLNGWDVAEACRAAKPEIPVIYTSGNSVDTSRRVDRSVFLSKPCCAVEISKTCRALIKSVPPRH